MRALIAASLLALLAGCAGTNFSFDNAAKVKPGMTEAQVTQLMGRPYSVVSRGDSQMWVWSHANGFSGSSKSISFEMREGKVVSVPSIPGAFTSNATTQIATPPAAAQAQPQPLSEQAYKQQQLDQLMQQNLPYEEYQKRHRQIMGE
ncbi:MAG: outer membrane protein assembly factor BamE [Gammaproteobacteria bacterium]